MIVQAATYQPARAGRPEQSIYVRSTTTKQQLIPCRTWSRSVTYGRRPAESLQPPARDHRFGGARSRLFARRGAGVHRAGRARGAATHRTDRPHDRLARPARDRRQRGPSPSVAWPCWSCSSCWRRSSRASCTPCHHAHRAAGGAGRPARAGPVRLHPEPVQPDRHHHAGRTGGEERHPHRRVRQPAARPGRTIDAAIREAAAVCACAPSS